MKAFVRWLSDPYVHVLSIAAVIVWLSAGIGAVESPGQLGVEAVCGSCLCEHEPLSACPLLASGISPEGSWERGMP